eukprot:1224333-Pyramimonas_sp.AAC.1
MSYTSGRWISPFGHFKRKKTQMNNSIASVVAMLCYVAWVRRVHVMIEQPRDSSFFKFPPVRDVLSQIGCSFHRVLQCHYGADLEKATLIATTIPSKHVELNSGKADRSGKRHN